MSNINVDDFASAITNALKEYSEEVDNIMQDEIEKISKEAKKSLSYDPEIPIRTGDYKKGFRIKKAAQGKGYKRNVIHNVLYQLTHLLEEPHKTRLWNGKVSSKPTTKAHPHWATAQKIVDKLPERIAKRLER